MPRDALNLPVTVVGVLSGAMWRWASESLCCRQLVHSGKQKLVLSPEFERELVLRWMQEHLLKV